MEQTNGEGKWRHLSGREQETVKKWKEVGLLDSITKGIEGKDEDIAMAMELIVNLMTIESTFIADFDKTSNLIIPIIARIIRGCPEILNNLDYGRISNIYTLVCAEVRNSYHIIDDLNGSPGFDIEAEFCAMIADSFINRYSNGE